MKRRSFFAFFLIGCATAPADDPSTPGPASADPKRPNDFATSSPDVVADAGLADTADGSAVEDAGTPATDPSDGFDAATLSSAWSVLHPEAVSIATTGSALRLTLTRPALWFNASQGVLVSKALRGDFKVTTTVRARRTSAPSEAPIGVVHLGGLMARDPSRPSENYVFIVAGRDENDLSVETKSTEDNVSAYEGPVWAGADAELRICRLGASFHLFKRPVGSATWTLAKTYTRPDLASTLDVGPNIYAATSPDLTVSFDEVRFAAVTDAASCAAD